MTVGTLSLATILSLSFATPLPAREPAEEWAVLEATLRQQVAEQAEAGSVGRPAIVCLGINPGAAAQSPSRELMARFGREPLVRRLTECDPRPSGAVEGTTRRPAIIVIAGPIEWRAVDEAWVTVTYFRSRSRSGLRRYRVVREPSGWVSLGPILLDGPM